MKTDVRSDPDEFDAAWMTDVLEEAGVARGATVTALDFEGYVGTGQMSRHGRFRLTWSEPAGRPPPTLATFSTAEARTRAPAVKMGGQEN